MEYDGFNLLLFQSPISSKLGPTQVGYLSNRPEPTMLDTNDLYEDSMTGKGGERYFGLSNSPIKDPWLKVENGEKAMEISLEQWRLKGETEHQLVDRMMMLLQ